VHCTCSCRRTSSCARCSSFASFRLAPSFVSSGCTSSTFSCNHSRLCNSQQFTNISTPHFHLHPVLPSNRYSDHATGCTIRGSIPCKGERYLSSPKRPEQLWGPPSLLSLGIKREGREVGPSPPTSTEVKDEWSCTSNLPYVFMTWTEPTLPSDPLLESAVPLHPLPQYPTNGGVVQ